MAKPDYFRAKTVKEMSASVIVSSKDLDMRLVEEIKDNFQDSLKLLDNWILIADSELLEGLLPLKKFIDDNYLKPKKMELYRGFNAGGFQEDLGIKTKGLFKKELILPKGNLVSMELKRPLSVSVDKGVAEGFGDTLVKTTLANDSNYLPIVDELSFIINESRNLVNGKLFETQREVILMPDQKFNFKVISYKGIAMENAPVSIAW